MESKDSSYHTQLPSFWEEEVSYVKKKKTLLLETETTTSDDNTRATTGGVRLPDGKATINGGVTSIHTPPSGRIWFLITVRMCIFFLYNVN